MAENHTGKITQVIGAVLDIKFSSGELPEINDAVEIPLKMEKDWSWRWHSIWEMIPYGALRWARQTDWYGEWKQKRLAVRSRFRWEKKHWGVCLMSWENRLTVNRHRREPKAADSQTGTGI